MDYFLIKGTFRVVGYSPDGDSLMFEASNKKHWDKIVTAHRELFDEKIKEKKGVLQLRLQGIDALETHYSPSPVPAPKDVKGKTSSKAIKPKMGKFRQPVEYGDAATHKMLEMFGVMETPKWKKSGWGSSYISEIKVTKGKKTTTYKKKHTEKLEGYVVVNDVDRKGRPIAWVFAGKTRSRDGSKLTRSKLAKILKQSANYQLAANGLVYPYFFFTLAASLRDILMNGVKNAQKKKLNIWSKDETAKGVTLKKTSHITQGHIFFPYLFRRIIKHQFRRMMEGYWEALRKKKSYKPKPESLFLDSFYADTNPYVFIISQREFKRLDEIVRTTKTKITMKVPPEDIVFLG